MISSSIKLIAFDLDGTLLDSVPDLTVAVDSAMRAMNKPGVSETQVRDWVGNGADNLVARALSQNIQVNPELPDALKQEARSLFDHFYAACGHTQSKLYPKVKESLEVLKQQGFQLAIITNKPYQFVPKILAQHQIDECFVDVLGGDTLEKRKPDPMPLLHLMGKHQLTREQLIMVGDSKNDILAAKNADIVSVALPYGYNHGEPIELAEPDYLIDDLSHLVTLLADF